MWKHLFIGVIFSASLLSISAQDKPSYKFFCPDNNYQAYGVFFGAGAFVSSGRTLSPAFTSQVSNTTAYQVNLSAQGAIGLSAELGGFFIPRTTFIRMVDFGIGYNQFKGSEFLDAHRTSGSDLSYPDGLFYNGKFKYHRLSFNMNAQMVSVLGPRAMFHQGPGILINRSLGMKNDYQRGFLPIGNDLPDKLNSTMMSYSAGLAFKLSQGVLLDFFVTKPIISLDNKSAFDITTKIYNSEFKELKVGVRLSFVKPTSDRVCPATSSGRNGSRLGKKRLRSDFYPW